jgi:hypothetical protein
MPFAYHMYRVSIINSVSELFNQTMCHFYYQVLNLPLPCIVCVKFDVDGRAVKVLSQTLYDRATKGFHSFINPCLFCVPSTKNV